MKTIIKAIVYSLLLAAPLYAATPPKAIAAYVDPGTGAAPLTGTFAGAGTPNAPPAALLYVFNGTTWGPWSGSTGGGGAPDPCVAGHNYGCLNTGNAWTGVQSSSGASTGNAPATAVYTSTDTRSGSLANPNNFFCPNLSAAGTCYMGFGQSLTPANAMYLSFTWQGNGNSFNSFGIAPYGSGNVFSVTAGGDATIGSSLAVGNFMKVPVYGSGTASNTDSSGTTTLTSGLSTITLRTFSGTYTNAPVCTIAPVNATASNVAALLGVAMQVSNTVLSVSTGAAAGANIAFDYTCTTRP